MYKIYLPLFLYLLQGSYSSQIEKLKLSSQISLGDDLFSSCQQKLSGSNGLFQRLFKKPNTVFDISTTFNETLSNLTVCELKLNHDEISFYSHAIQDQVQIEHNIGNFRFRESFGVQINKTYYLKTHYHFYLMIDKDEQNVKDIQVISDEVDYVKLKKKKFNISFTVEYIDISNISNQTHAYVGRILVKEIKYFVCFSFLFLGTILTIISTMFMKNKYRFQKEYQDEENEENFAGTNGALINFELFITQDELIAGICIISNGVQLILFIILSSLSSISSSFDYLSQNYESSVLVMYLICSIGNGVSIWWTLVQTKKTILRKSKLLWQSCKAALLYPVIILLFNKSFFPLIIIDIIQAVGIIVGMAFGASFIHDGFGEHKQLFFSESKFLKRYDIYIIMYGLIPYLSIHILIKDQLNFWIGIIPFSLDMYYLLTIIAYSSLIFAITLFFTMSDTGNCKTTWNRMSIQIASAPLFWLITYQIIYVVKHNDEIKSLFQYLFFSFIINLITFYITGAISLLSSIAIQKHIQSQYKLE